MYHKKAPDAMAEAATLTWLRTQGLPAAEVLDVGPDWLLTREVIGRTGADPWPEHQRLKVVDALADITRALHALPVAACPFDRTLAVAVPEACAALSAGRVDVDDLDAERQGWTATELLDALTERLPEMLSREAPAVTHGDWCLPNVVFDPDAVEVVGLVDTARTGRADRYADLALMSRSLSSQRLNPQYGSRCSQRYLKRCGYDSADDDKLTFYRLLDEFF
jgi:kanamycin kinase